MGKEMNVMEKFRKNQKEKLKKRKKEIEGHLREKGEEPKDRSAKTRDSTKQQVQIYKTNEVTAEIQFKRDLYWEEQRKIEKQREVAHKPTSRIELPANLKIRPPLEPYPFADEYEDIYYDCLRDHKTVEDLPSGQQIAQTLRNQYEQKMAALVHSSMAAAEQERFIQEEVYEEDQIREDDGHWGQREASRSEVVAERETMMGKRGSEATNKPQHEVNSAKYLIQQAPQLTKEFMLTKERPNFVPRQIADKLKKDQELKEQQVLREAVDKELLEEEALKKVVKKAESDTNLLAVPRPQFALDEDDEDFED